MSRRGGDDAQFPFSVPAIRALDGLSLERPVTFFVGENGSGKTTLLEGSAAASRLPTVGSAERLQDDTLEAQRRLGKALRLSWARRTARGFFLRAEDFFGFTKRLARMRAELIVEMREAAALYTAGGRSQTAVGLEHGPLLASIAELARRYGAALPANSHAAGFMNLLHSRFVTGC